MDATAGRPRSKTMRSDFKLGVALIATVGLIGGITAARSEEKAVGKQAGKAAKTPPKPAMVEGAWTGSWGPYVAPKPEGADAAGDAKKYSYTRLQKQLDCKVKALANGDFEATFEGECGRPYKYTIKMLGRASTGSVLFKGTTDLGEQDGGVYDWIGRATDKEFLGFYTSGSHTGTFTLARPKPDTAAPTATK